MKLIVDKSGINRFLKWMQRTLAATSVLLLGWCLFVLADSWVFQKQESAQLNLLLAAHAEAVGTFPKAASGEVTGRWPPVMARGLIGRMDIPRLHLTAMVVEGTSSSALRRAIGHISGTSLPGVPGNIGISGHRDTFFRPLRHIRENDIITLTTLTGEHHYRVVSIRIVAPTDIEVLEQTTSEVLTLVTCYPFYFVGSAPDRFIVRAERVS